MPFDSSQDDSTLGWYSQQGFGTPPEYVVGDLVNAMLPDRVRNVYVHARVTEVIRGVSYGVLSLHGNYFHVFEQDICLMTAQDLIDLCDGELDLAHARMTIENQTFGVQPQQVAQIIDAAIERGQPSDAEERLRTEVSPGATVADSGLLNNCLMVQRHIPDACALFCWDAV